ITSAPAVNIQENHRLYADFVSPAVLAKYLIWFGSPGRSATREKYQGLDKKWDTKVSHIITRLFASGVPPVEPTSDAMDTAIGALHPQTIILSIRPSGRAGRFLGYIGDELIVTNQQPFLDGVRDSAMKMPD